MSDNPLSIDEIIKRAETIKAEAERQLANAQKSLDEKAQSAIKEVSVDSKAVMEKVEKLSSEEEEIKTFEPTKSSEKNNRKESSDNEKTQAVRLNFQKKDKTKIINLKPHTNTKAVKIEDEKNEGDEDVKIFNSPSFSKDEDIFEENIFPSQKTKPVVISSNDSPESDELQEVPTLVARENLGNYLEGDDIKQNTYKEEIGIQMSFDGFDDEVEEVPTIDEEVAEKILNEQRKEKVDKFRLFGPDKTDSELGDEEYQRNDYKSENQQSNILRSLFAKKKRILIQIISTLVLGIIVLLMTVLKDNALMPQFLTSSHNYLIVGAILIFIADIINYNIFFHAFNFKKGINSDLPVALTNIAIFAQTICFIFIDNLWLDNGQFLGLAAVLSLLISQMGKRQMMVRIIDNFDFIINLEDKHSLENIANAVDCEIISRGILEEENPIIKTGVKTDFPTNFMEISCKVEPSDNLIKKLSPVMWLISIILGIIVGFTESKYTGINMGITALAITTPFAIIYQMNSLLTDVSADLDKYSSRVCGFDGANMASTADAVVMEAADLFGKNGCDLHGIKVFHNAKVDDAIIYAAAVIIQTNGPLSHVFDDVIIGKQSILPHVENVIYEEQMGTSAWVYQRKVLVGNRNLLINHGIEVPKESFERKYTRKNRKALYLAVNGKIMAMFVVSYSADPDLKRELKKLEKSDITIIAKSNDPYINEESIANLFNLPKGFIRIMSYPGARVYSKYSEMRVEKSPSYLIHNGEAKSLLAGIRGAISIVKTRKLINFLTVFGCVLGFAAVVFMCIIKGYSQLTAMAVVGFGVIWNIFVYIASKIHRIGF